MDPPIVEWLASYVPHRPIIHHHVGGRGKTMPLHFSGSRVFFYDADPYVGYGGIMPYCLGARRGDARLYITANPYASSLHQPDPSIFDYFSLETSETYREMLRVDKTLVVGMWPLDEVIEKDGLPWPDVLSLDTQGSELDVLKGASKALETVEVIVCEVEYVPMYFSQPLVGEVTAWLKVAGFKCRGPLEEHFIQRGNESPVLGFADLIFTRH